MIITAILLRIAEYLIVSGLNERQYESDKNKVAKSLENTKAQLYYPRATRDEYYNIKQILEDDIARLEGLLKTKGKKKREKADIQFVLKKTKEILAVHEIANYKYCMFVKY